MAIEPTFERSQSLSRFDNYLLPTCAQDYILVDRVAGDWVNIQCMKPKKVFKEVCVASETFFSRENLPFSC